MEFAKVDSYSQQAANQFRRIDSETGLSSNQINTIFSDRNGAMWFATVSGLNRYDGYSFKIFKNNPEDPSSLPENSIQRIFEDYLGYLWLFTNNTFYIFNPFTETFGTDHEVFNQKIQVPKNNISTLRLNDDGSLWISNSQSGLFYFSPTTKLLKHLHHNETDKSSISSNHIMDVVFSRNNLVYIVNSSGIIDVIDSQTLKVIDSQDYGNLMRNGTDQNFRLFVDSDENFWVYSINSGDGLYFINRKTNEYRSLNSQTSPFYLTSNLISGIIEDNSGKIWVSTDHGGINIINKENLSVEHIINVPGDLTSLSANTVTSIHKSPDNIIWVGTYKNGINYYHEQLYQFKLFRSQPFQQSKYFFNDVNCFAEDKKGNLWIGTNGKGLVYFDRSNNSYKTYNYQSGNSKGLSSDIIVCLYIDHKERLWIGTYQGGLNCFDGTKFKIYRNKINDPGSLSNDRIWQIYEDKTRRLWIGTLGGGLELYNEDTDSFIHHREGDFNSINTDYVLAITEDKKGNLYIGTSGGFSILDAGTRRFRNYFFDSQNPKGLSQSSVLSILEDSRGRIWIGTRNGLNLFNPESNDFRVFRDEHGLPDNNIISMLDDGFGDIWIATLNGLSNLKSDDKNHTFRFINYDVLDGLQGSEFNEHSALRTRKGELIFGGANGFNIFHPAEIVEHHHDFKVVLTDFKLFNRSIGIGEKINDRIILDKALNLSSEISIEQKQKVFSIEFSALNYFDPERTRFRYMLEGFNEQWIETGAKNRFATFTNLNPGTYVFRVKASASDGSWGDNETRIVINIIPPFYVTKWAIAVYFLIFVLLVFLLVFTIRRRARIHFQREQERAEYERLRDLDALKIKFFTNVSHEFRTPLALIITPLDKLIKETGDTKLVENLSLIKRNAKRLLSLVNQLLDFRKMEVDKCVLNTSFGDINRFLEDIFYSFNDLFESKSIKYKFTSDISSYFVNFDHDKMEKIIFNLISNAVKFTPENGEIELTVNRKNRGNENFNDCFNGSEYLEILVSDNGIGIAHDKQVKIFERFFQNENPPSLIHQGSGIGLSLTQEFVRLHGGTIEVKSEPGLGSTFIVKLPLTTEKPELENVNQNFDENQENINNYEKPLVIIIDDNEDLRFYLKENLKQNFTILESKNAREGWYNIVSKKPQLVVSDIMMPGENGIELCRRIKNDSKTSHIPVILLSARTSVEQKIEGLEAGADDYVTKPFNYEILELKISQLIKQRNMFRNNFSRKFEIKPGEIGITSLDEKFLKKALKEVEKNIGNSEFSVEKLGKELGVSRGHLYNKLVALTGKTPIEFIRVMRLKRAAQLLAKSQQTVSEIAYQVGFNDSKYFTKYFKDEFGIVPSEFAKNHKEID